MKITPRQRASGTDYRINCGRRPDGSRWVEFRSTLQEARARAAEIESLRKRVGEIADGLTAQQLQDVVAAYELLSCTDITLTRAAEIALAHRPTKNLHAVAVLWGDFLGDLEARAADGQLRPASLAAARSSLGAFVNDFWEEIAERVTGEQIERWMRKQNYGPASFNRVLRYITQLFNFAPYGADNPAAGIRPAKKVYSEPGFMSPEDVERLFAIAWDEAPHIVARMALGFFCGIRSEELDRLEWAHVYLDTSTVRVSAEVSKTHFPRVVDIPGNALHWLIACRRPGGPIGPSSSVFFATRRRLCAALEIEWPHNAMRHTFATFHFAHHRQPQRTAEQLGHVQGVKLLYQHYRGLATSDAAARYWEIRPRTTAAETQERTA